MIVVSKNLKVGLCGNSRGARGRQIQYRIPDDLFVSLPYPVIPTSLGPSLSLAGPSVMQL